MSKTMIQVVSAKLSTVCDPELCEGLEALFYTGVALLLSRAGYEVDADDVIRYPANKAENDFVKQVSAKVGYNLHSLTDTSQISLIMAYQIIALEDYGKQGALIRKLAMLNFTRFLMELCDPSRKELDDAMNLAANVLVIANR